MTINNFRGDLTDISAKKKVLSESKSPRTGLEQPPPWCRDTDAGAYSLLARAHGTSASVLAEISVRPPRKSFIFMI